MLANLPRMDVDGSREVLHRVGVVLGGQLNLLWRLRFCAECCLSVLAERMMPCAAVLDWSRSLGIVNKSTILKKEHDRHWNRRILLGMILPHFRYLVVATRSSFSPFKAGSLPL